MFQPNPRSQVARSDLGLLHLSRGDALLSPAAAGAYRVALGAGVGAGGW